MVIADRYEVIRSLGSGGMGTVVLAEDTLLRRQVAVKLLHGDGDEAMAQRLQREARIGASLNHPNLVTVFDTLLHEGRLVVVMEFVDGQNLAQAIKAGPIDPARGLAILSAVGAALDHAHAAGVVHRDVKPANILLGPGGTVKLTDLGIAIAADSTRVTQTGAALGSVAYMAPEQFRAGDPTPATDVHALATVAFELLGGRKARVGASQMEIVSRIDSEPPPDVREVWPAAPPAAAEVLTRGMAHDPAERPASACGLVSELEAALGEPAPEPEPEPEPTPAPAPAPAVASAPAPAPVGAPAPARSSSSRPSRRGLLAGALAALLLLGVLVAALAGGGDDPPTRAADEGSATTEPEASPSPTPSSEPDPAPSATPGAAEDAEAPAAAVRALYERAASQDSDGVCALLGPKLKAQFSCESFTSQFSTLRSVDFEQDEVTEETAEAATVAVRTTARHTDRTERCTGDIGLVPGGPEGWLVDELGVDCVRG